MAGTSFIIHGTERHPAGAGRQIPLSLVHGDLSVSRNWNFRNGGVIGRWTPSGTVKSLSAAHPAAVDAQNPGPLHPSTLYSTASLGRKGLPSSPRRQRCCLVFQALISGLKAHVAQVEQEIGHLRSEMDGISFDSPSKGKLFEFDRRLRSAERKLKRTEFQLAKVEELNEKYETHLKVQEGAENMANAYHQQWPRPRKRLGADALNSIRGGLKDLEQMMGRIQSQLQLFAGTLHIQIKGIIGFARVTAGDVFEVALKHGHQKWKARGKTGPNRSQSWDQAFVEFQCLPWDFLEIKASEVKSLGKTSLLAEQNCDPLQFLVSEPQLFTMNLNLHGSLKLNLVVNWRPATETENFWAGSPGVERKPAGTASTGRRTLSVYFGDRSPSSKPKALDKLLNRAATEAELANSSKDKRQTATEEAELGAGSHGLVSPPPLLSLLRALNPLMEKLQCHFKELTDMQNLLLQWNSLLKRRLLSGSENAGRRPTSITDKRSNRQSLFSEDLDDNFVYRNGTWDSGVGTESSTSNSQDSPDTGWRPSLPRIFHAPDRSFSPSQRRFRLLNNRRKSLGALMDVSASEQPLPSGSGNREIDQCLYHHLLRAQMLLKSLEQSSYGPLHFRRQQILVQLREETRTLHLLAQYIRTSEETPILTHVLNDLGAEPEIQDLWLAATLGHHWKLMVPTSAVKEQLIQSYAHVISERYPDLVDAAFLELERTLTIGGNWDPEWATVFQFVASFRDKQMQSLMESLAHETWIVESLKTRVAATVEQVMQRVEQVPVAPPTSCLRQISLLLLDALPDLQLPSEQYLKRASGSLREQILTWYLSFLEEDDPLTRRGACRALALLRVHRSIPALSFLARTDRKAQVREEAKRTLTCFGFKSDPVPTAEVANDLRSHEFTQ